MVHVQWDVKVPVGKGVAEAVATLVEAVAVPIVVEHVKAHAVTDVQADALMG